MPGMRFMSIGAEGPPVAASIDGQFQLLRVAAQPGGPDSDVNTVGEFFQLICVIEKDSFTMGQYGEKEGRKLLEYCAAFPDRARHAARRFHYQAEIEPMFELAEAAQRWEPKLPRDVRVSIEVQVQMKGTDADIEEYLRGKLGYAVAIKKIHSIEVKDA